MTTRLQFHEPPDGGQHAAAEIRHVPVRDEQGMPGGLQGTELAQAAFNDVCTPGNPRQTNVEEILAIYKKAF